ncbi:ComEA family DNA-binding protein [Actinoplanes sp. NPDC049265]|uniref:ComEA family DNA-binding protein n=1 Tax=Actinoplanes sp. NPDC049265 TaxID=3363902 RepID=UPI00371E577E
MPKRDENDEVAAARFRSVLATDTPVRDLFADRSPVRWSELIPSWPDDVDLPDPPPPESVRPQPQPRSQPDRSPAELAAVAASRQPWQAESIPGTAALPLRAGAADFGTWTAPDVSVADLGVRPVPQAEDEDEREPRLSPAGAFGGRLAAFDIGRPGVKALAVVAALVVIIAAFLAWRARPHTETVVPDEPRPPASVLQDEKDPLVVPSPSGAAPAPVVVAVAGKVVKPGLVTLPAGARVADALAAAGGAKRGVDPGPLNLARKVVDGELIMVGGPQPSGGAVAPAAGGGSAPGVPINLNTATLADLDNLPGVGPVLAQRILEARDAQGGFKTVGDLRKVNGIGASRFEQLKDLVTV